MLHNPDNCFLGKGEAKPPHIMAHEFVDFEKLAPSVPQNVINSNNQTTPLAMYLNDREGDCTCAGVGNTLRLNSDGATQLTDNDIQAAYIAITAQENNGQGYNPATGANDNGCVELDVLDYWVKIGIGGDKLLGHAGINMQDWSQVKSSAYLGGSIYPGWQLSTDQQQQQIWQPGTAAAGSWGGHCAPIADAYDVTPAGMVINGVSIPAGVPLIVLLTWASYKPALKTYIPFACDEGHFLITDAWLARAKADPTLAGVINFTVLENYLKSLQQES